MWWVVGIVAALVVLAIAIKIAMARDGEGDVDPAAGRTCDACAGPLRAIVQGTPWVYYHCPSCRKDFCNPCVAQAGHAHRTSAACPKCGRDLRDSRR